VLGIFHTSVRSGDRSEAAEKASASATAATAGHDDRETGAGEAGHSADDCGSQNDYSSGESTGVEAAAGRQGNGIAEEHEDC
jgi:hypothetical protein